MALPGMGTTSYEDMRGLRAAGRAAPLRSVPGRGHVRPQQTVAPRRKIDMETTQQYENTPNESSCVPKSA